MKIEWLNAECTEAIVTKGWFRKVQARVSRRIQIDGSIWVFAATGRVVGSWLDSVLRTEHYEATVTREWVPVRRDKV